MNRPRVERLVRDLLVELGEAPSRRALAGTPGRVAEVFSTFQLRREIPPAACWEPAAPGQLVVMRDLGFLSLCEHHLLPFFGNCQVGFAFRTRACDLEWCGDVVKTFAHQLQLQERLTEQIADALFEALEPEGLGVVMDGHHMCMMMRGVEKQNSHIQTSTLRGTFLDRDIRRSFFSHVLQGA